MERSINSVEYKLGKMFIEYNLYPYIVSKDNEIFIRLEKIEMLFAKNSPEKFFEEFKTKYPEYFI